MATIRVSALGAGSKVAAALLPVPAMDARAFQSRAVVYGSPGIIPIPAPAPVPGTDRSLISIANEGNIGLPSSLFNYWLPAVYFTDRHGMSRAPVSVFSDNQMPVPAIDPRGLPIPVMPGPVILNQHQVANPRVTPKFATRKARNGRR